jgi:glycine hydroxymethyltransferase
MINRALGQADPEMAKVLAAELDRQQHTLVMIPSENYASRAVLHAAGCIMTNKYAEGYPGRRYYNGCEWVDEAERLAVERARALFGAEHANVQPHTGTQANMAAYYALLREGDTILAMDLAQGGHLSHGSPVSFSGRYYKVHFYGVSRDTERLDYDQVLETAKQCRPQLIVTGASAYPRVIDFERFKQIADEVGAYLVSDIAHIAGLIVAGVHPDCVPYSDVVTTTTHKTLRGPRGALILCREKWAKAIDRAVFPGLQGGPLMHLIAAKAVCLREAQESGFREYQAQIVRNAQALAQTLMDEGLRLVSGGTDNHLMLVDLTDTGLTGKEAANRLERAGICVNKNLIPFDQRKPTETSGIRPGTPAITSRGMKEPEMKLIGQLMARVIRDGQDPAVVQEVRGLVYELCERFPVYVDL